MQNEDTVTAYKNAEPKKQEQSLPGSEKDLEPFAGEYCSSLLPKIFFMGLIDESLFQRDRAHKAREVG